MKSQYRFPRRGRGFVPTIAMLLPLAGLAAACSGDASRTPTGIVPPSSANSGKNVSGSNQRILFESSRAQGIEVFSIRPDGTDPIQLTNADGVSQNGVWSPDGKRIAFVSSRETPRFQVFVMNADGTNVVRLTPGSANNSSPSWSKDGKHIIFESTRDAADQTVVHPEDFELYVMNDDGTGVVRLTNNNVFDGQPTFSPDGRSIAFTSDRDHTDTKTTELYLMDVDGANTRRVTNQAGSVEYPSWDPHSRHLAFSISSSKNGDAIFTLDLDNSGLTQLTPGGASADTFPSWSADGSQLAFTSMRDAGGGSEIYRMNADGTEQARLTVNPGQDAHPRWSR